MKKWLLISLMCGGLSTPALAVADSVAVEVEGTQFRDLSFEQALTAARDESKMVFLDCYTSWCNPCRQMAVRVFPTREVGDFLNRNFVCIKMDMEQGEGVELAERYDVLIYPTYLVINPDGRMQHKAVGAIEGKGFIGLISAAFDPAKALGPRLARFEAGERDPEFLKELLSYLTRIHDSHAEVVAAECGE